MKDVYNQDFFFMLQAFLCYAFIDNHMRLKSYASWRLSGIIGRNVALSLGALRYLMKVYVDQF